MRINYEVNLMRTIEIKYPETIPAILNLSPDKFEQEAKFALAVKLYEIGQLTSGQAAQLAGISRAAFLLNCRRFGAASVDWDNDEINAEFADINR